LSLPEHRITFHFTPRHASWLNQIEIWFSILVRKLLRRGNFDSKKALRTKIEEFIAYPARAGTIVAREGLVVDLVAAESSHAMFARRRM
jgi:hypothetical protein